MELSKFTEDTARNRQTWIRALRSGEYEQGSKALRSERGFCPLGVACDLFDSTVWTQDRWGWFMWKADHWCWLPQEVSKVLGFALTNSRSPICSCPLDPVIDRPGGLGGWRPGEVSIINLNDRQGKTFAEIADLIEGQPPEWQG